MLSDFTCAEKVYICCGYTDLRQGIDGLSALVQLEFDLDPFSNTLSRQADTRSAHSPSFCCWLTTLRLFDISVTPSPRLSVQYLRLAATMPRVSVTICNCTDTISYCQAGQGSRLCERIYDGYTLKTECLYRAHFTSRADVEQLVSEYIDFYNFERISLKNGLIPVEIRSKAA